MDGGPNTITISEDLQNGPKIEEAKGPLTDRPLPVMTTLGQLLNELKARNLMNQD